MMQIDDYALAVWRFAASRPETEINVDMIVGQLLANSFALLSIATPREQMIRTPRGLMPNTIPLVVWQRDLEALIAAHEALSADAADGPAFQYWHECGLNLAALSAKFRRAADIEFDA